MAHEPETHETRPRGHRFSNPRGRDSVSQQQTPQGDGGPAPPAAPPGGPDDEEKPPPGGPGGPPPGPPPPNPPGTPPPAPPDVDDPSERPNKKKSHVKKPEDFDDAKQWDKYKRQTFVYIQENKKDFSNGESVVRFLLSFMTGGLPEKFAANFIDEVIADYEEEMKDYRDYGGDEPDSRLGN
jgi:hypothetical protein